MNARDSIFEAIRTSNLELLRDILAPDPAAAALAAAKNHNALAEKLRAR